ncbi:formyl transferase [Halorubrum distributum JCM 13561]|uniref:phosphoribosylglycinamide formyltransferase 1 n=1 Tax=Halorubrum distributum JCM 13561 TaxID=1227483 RepID=M0NTK7_9EURY|nr:formyl transferase [Halorubrum litoreum]EMA61292.1 formyl transferase [Halorubrum litoreum JCM 13561]
MVDVVILTNSQLRHQFVRKAIALHDDINILQTYCESTNGSTIDRVREEGDEVKLRHLESRAESEDDFFRHFVDYTPDNSNHKEIPNGDINDEQYYEEIVDLNPDLLVAYGCSIIEDPLLSEYEGRFLNVHLGLSPYYRGTGTNFWPLVNGEPEYVGATFMYLDAGVDTGDIIHQIRARVKPGDTPHQIGNRLIADMVGPYREIITKFGDLSDIEQPETPDNEHYYTMSDYSTEATQQLYENFDDGLVDDYLADQDERTADVPLVKNPILESR